MEIKVIDINRLQSKQILCCSWRRFIVQMFGCVSGNAQIYQQHLTFNFSREKCKASFCMISKDNFANNQTPSRSIQINYYGDIEHLH